MRGLMTGMDEVKDAPTFALLPEGQYVVEVAEVSDGMSKGGDPMIKVTLKVKDGEYKGRLIWDYIILSTNPQSKGWNIRWRAKMFLKAIGELHHGDNFDWDSDRWPFKNCAAVIEHEVQKEGKYAGQKQAKIKQYLALDNGADDSDIPF